MFVGSTSQKFSNFVLILYTYFIMSMLETFPTCFHSFFLCPCHQCLSFVIVLSISTLVMFVFHVLVSMLGKSPSPSNAMSLFMFINVFHIIDEPFIKVFQQIGFFFKCMVFSSHPHHLITFITKQVDFIAHQGTNDHRMGHLAHQVFQQLQCPHPVSFLPCHHPPLYISSIFDFLCH